MDKTKDRKENRLNVRYVHVTLQKITNPDKEYWVDKGKYFKDNVKAVLVGIEENHQERKGVHAHIVIQFTTRQDLSRRQFVKHFGTDSIHIAPKADKNALIMALGYVSKTGNNRSFGTFTYKGIEIPKDPDVLRFKHLVRNREDGMEYFRKVVKENIKKGEVGIIEKFAERDDPIGTWLQINPACTKKLEHLENTYRVEYVNGRKKGIEARDFAKDPEQLRQVYKYYLREFPKVFINNRKRRNIRALEKDYDQHIEHDLAQMGVILDTLEEAEKYGPDRPRKSMNLHIWSKLPGFGKTRLVEFLEEITMVFGLPEDKYYVDYKNGVFKVLVSDEAEMFLSTKKYSHLKVLLEGRPAEFNRKGKQKIIKRDNPLVMLCSNRPLKETMEMIFGEKHQEDPMKDRVRCVELKSRATLHFMISCVFGWDEDNPKMVELPSKVIGLPLLKAMEENHEDKKEKNFLIEGRFNSVLQIDRFSLVGGVKNNPRVVKSVNSPVEINPRFSGVFLV